MITISRIVALLAAFMVVRASAAEAPPTMDIVKQIKPILAGAYITFHYSKSLFGNLNLEHYAHTFVNRKEIPAIILGLPDQSPLYQTLIPPQSKKKKASGI